MHFVVEDNGMGMSNRELASILESKPEGHFGLYSVNHRLKLIFGEAYGVKISSKLELGTRVEIILPAKEDLGGQ